VNAARTFTIAELAEEFDVTARAIRFYEGMGLLEPALKLTLRGKRLGLALSEIKQLVDMYDSPSDNAAQLQAFLKVLGAHRGQLEQQLEDIHITLEEIGQHEARCRALLGPRSKPRKEKAA
jgi:DNA-binding transcriptional MerR regulator